MINDNWLTAVQQIMTVLQEQSRPTIAADGSINQQSYTYQPTGSRAVSLSFFINLIIDGPITVGRIWFTFCGNWISEIRLPSIG